MSSFYASKYNLIASSLLLGLLLFILNIIFKTQIALNSYLLTSIIIGSIIAGISYIIVIYEMHAHNNHSFILWLIFSLLIQFYLKDISEYFQLFILIYLITYWFLQYKKAREMKHENT